MLPLGNTNLSLVNVTVTFTGYGADDSTVIGMEACCAVNVTVCSVARLIFCVCVAKSRS